MATQVSLGTPRHISEGKEDAGIGITFTFDHCPVLQTPLSVGFPNTQHAHTHALTRALKCSHMPTHVTMHPSSWFPGSPGSNSSTKWWRLDYAHLLGLYYMRSVNSYCKHLLPVLAPYWKPPSHLSKEYFLPGPVPHNAIGFLANYHLFPTSLNPAWLIPGFHGYKQRQCVSSWPFVVFCCDFTSLSPDSCSSGL